MRGIAGSIPDLAPKTLLHPSKSEHIIVNAERPMLWRRG